MSRRDRQFREEPSENALPLVRNHFRPQSTEHDQSYEPLEASGQSGDSILLSEHSQDNMSVTVSEEELRHELSLLGFSYVPRQRLLEFKKDLERLMNQGGVAASPETSRLENETIEETTNTTAPPPAESNAWHHQASAWPTTTATSSTEWGNQQRSQDSYTKHTVSLGGNTLPTKKAPQITRKVLRRKSDGQTHVSDESFLYSETETEEGDSGSSIVDFRSESSGRSSASCIKSFIRPPPYSLLDQYRQRSDPVGRYQEYKQKWDALQVALERSRKELRWGIREQMMSAPPQPAPRSVPPPNTYVIPTDKKRYALRWAVRQDLVNGVMPRGSYS
ncbi:hypothetical protein XENTR_v10023725 [Xenopus tropicalis]|uniref:Centriolar and ciliogenesis associated n=1 Tax=Xenopus tropicalis TaxID=8364 RepID=A0A6I8RYD1_XENTR|nr:hydrolethalus syndrome protein 1 [Xenopus tropicalis]KAE8578680.1 hypothetical protein XENTR_v10023725 [Xenopus tropicalis]|eukprot:XP_004918159.1 PREDICTED: hydrolethalus syndrome protein 1 [Xenopus tropicalis]